MYYTKDVVLLSRDKNLYTTCYIPLLPNYWYSIYI